MAFQFKGFRATKPTVRLKDSDKGTYEAFFILYDSAGKKHYMRYSHGINSLPIAKRKVEASGWAQVLWEGLQKGWNPLTDRYPNWIKEERDKSEMTFLFDQALDYALAIKKEQLSRYSYYDYDGAARFMKAAAKETGHSTMDVKLIERKDIRLIVATAKENNNWSNNSRNKYLTHLKALFTVLVDEELIKFNPAHGIKNEESPDGPGYARLTDPEKESIATHLMIQAPDFFEYLMFIYQSGIRRKELLMIKIGDINIHTRKIDIRPEVAKTNQRRSIPIPDDIMEILLRREVWKLPKAWYLFSNKEFAPGEFPYHPNTPTSWWRKMVISDETGLGINCKMYSLKHKGADDKIQAGMDLDVLKTLYGHRSKQMTEIYARAVREKYAEKIIEGSPVFAKVIHLGKKRTAE